MVDYGSFVLTRRHILRRGVLATAALAATALAACASPPAPPTSQPAPTGAPTAPASQATQATPAATAQVASGPVTLNVTNVEAYSAELERCYVVSASLATARTYVQLRLAPTRNKQKLRVN